MARNPKSIGEMISTVTFFGVGVACVIQALTFYEDGLLIRSYVSIFAGFLCALGGLRFVIADLVKMITKGRHK
ncbi:hypothetical protein OAM77_04775 [Alphaproteobacteria bacterium]|nr:hypothetical protein [Alphaproteobacteria bacterium]